MSYMDDEIYLGPVPGEENCEQLGPHYDGTRARQECRAYIALLRRALGEEPEGARLVVKSNPHDFGTYLEVVCRYDSASGKALKYALKCESEGPREWDEQAMTELGLDKWERR